MLHAFWFLEVEGLLSNILEVNQCLSEVPEDQVLKVGGYFHFHLNVIHSKSYCMSYVKYWIYVFLNYRSEVFAALK